MPDLNALDPGSTPSLGWDSVLWLVGGLVSYYSEIQLLPLDSQASPLLVGTYVLHWGVDLSTKGPNFPCSGLKNHMACTLEQKDPVGRTACWEGLDHWAADTSCACLELGRYLKCNLVFSF